MLSESGYVTIVDQLAAAGIGGGAAYDALIGATAAEHGHVLITADHRARPTYDAVGITYDFFEL
jgi:predicted nucleic acid-binding protein